MSIESTLQVAPLGPAQELGELLRATLHATLQAGEAALDEPMDEAHRAWQSAAHFRLLQAFGMPNWFLSHFFAQGPNALKECATSPQKKVAFRRQLELLKAYARGTQLTTERNLSTPSAPGNYVPLSIIQMSGT